MDTEGRGPEGAGRNTGRAATAGGGAAPAGLTCDGMRRLALDEMALRRRRLGELTPAQECALESLLVSVADNIADLVSAAAEPPRLGGAREARAPTTRRAGALSPAPS